MLLTESEKTHTPERAVQSSLAECGKIDERYEVSCRAELVNAERSSSEVFALLGCYYAA
jgi:hypothetical protein